MAVMGATTAAQAQLYGFRQMESGALVDGATVMVSEAGINPGNGNVIVHFTFRNIVGSSTAKITDIWFDDRCSPALALRTFDSIIDGPGVLFDFGASPSAPPNANSLCPAFETTMSFSAGLD